MNNLIPALLTLLPLFIVALVLRWIRQIKINGDIQVEQNKQLLSLLQNI